MARLQKLNEIAASLTTALQLAAATDPGSAGHRSAWARASEACLDLGYIVSDMEGLRPLVHAAQRRVTAKK